MNMRMLILKYLGHVYIKAIVQHTVTVKYFHGITFLHAEKHEIQSVTIMSHTVKYSLKIADLTSLQ